MAPGVFLYSMGNASERMRPLDEPVSDQVRWGMLVDTNRCADGCDACVTACNEEHGLTGHDRPATDAQWIRKITIRDKATSHTKSFPVMCQHCETPPCVDVCPTGASFPPCRRHRAGGQAHLYRLPLLHDGLPVQGALICA